MKSSKEFSGWDRLSVAEKIAIPLAGTILGFLINLGQTRSDDVREKIAMENRYDATVADYFDDMAQLQLDEQLHENLPEQIGGNPLMQEGQKALQIARARTLNVARQLDGERKGQLLRFLYESRLIGQCSFNSTTLQVEQCKPRILDLGSARLDKVELDPPMPLQGIDLTGALLTEAKLRTIDLSNAEMQRIKLESADLTETLLIGADLTGANLTEATLAKAGLKGATLIKSNLQGADLREAKLQNAQLQISDLRGADLTDADLTDANLQGAGYDKSTKFPKGFDPNANAMKLCPPIGQKCELDP